MTIVNDENDVICCCTDGCKKKFDSVHGWKVHYGHEHEKRTTECVRCEEEFHDRHASQKRQCLDCVTKYGRLTHETLPAN